MIESITVKLEGPSTATIKFYEQTQLAASLIKHGLKPPRKEYEVIFRDKEDREFYVSRNDLDEINRVISGSEKIMENANG